MGLLGCFAPDSASHGGAGPLKKEVGKLTQALADAKTQVAQLKNELVELKADRAHLLDEVRIKTAPQKQDASTEMPTVSVAVQAKPPVNMESRIPRLTMGIECRTARTSRHTTDDPTAAPASTNGAAAATALTASVAADASTESSAVAKSPAPGSRIPARPCQPGDSPTRSPSLRLPSIDTPPALAAIATAAAAEPASPCTGGIPRSPKSPHSPKAVAHIPKSPRSPTAAASVAAAAAMEQALLQQRIEVLQHQLRVAESFRLSLEAELRDARFANSNLQTQVLSLQTKFEKAVEDQVMELEKLSNLRKENHDSHEQTMQQVSTLKRQLSRSSAAYAAAQREADAAVKLAGAQEQKLQQYTAELAGAKEELNSYMSQMAKHKAEADSLAHQLKEVRESAAQSAERVKQLEAAAQEAEQQHAYTVKQLEDELKAQKAIYDSTVEEMLQLSTNYNELKQAYHKLQSETQNHDQMVQLVQQELSELSYYAAAGRVALGLAPASILRHFTTSEVAVAVAAAEDGEASVVLPSAASAASAAPAAPGELPAVEAPATGGSAAVESAAAVETAAVESTTAVESTATAVPAAVSPAAVESTAAVEPAAAVGPAAVESAAVESTAAVEPTAVESAAMVVEAVAEKEAGPAAAEPAGTASEPTPAADTAAPAVSDS